MRKTLDTRTTRRAAALCLPLLALFVAPYFAFAANFADARAVYDRGDFGTAREMFEPLANAGDAKAQSMMGTIYFLGRGIPPDRDRAKGWYAKAAAQGEPNAQYQMFALSMNPKDVKPGAPMKLDPAAVDYLRKAALQDHPGAQMWLSLVLSDGRLYPKDEAESFKWLRKAAEFDNVLAHLRLSKAYAEGAGTQVDNVESYYWLCIAKARAARLQGPGAKMMQGMFNLGQDPLRAKLTAEQIADAERRAAVWQPKPVPDFGTDPYIPMEKTQLSGPPAMPGAQ